MLLTPADASEEFAKWRRRLLGLDFEVVRSVVIKQQAPDAQWTLKTKEAEETGPDEKLQLLMIEETAEQHSV